MNHTPAIRALPLPPDCATDATIPTAAHAIRVIGETWKDLPQKRRADLISACRNAARLAGLPADVLRMDPVVLRERVLRGTAAEFGVAEGTMRNLRSALRYILARLGVIEPPLPEPTPAWKSVLERVNIRAAAGLIRLARYCSTHGIAPSELTSDTLADFAVYLRTQVLCPSPAHILGTARGLWNRCCASDPGWPGKPLPKAQVDGQAFLPLKEFTAGFVADLNAFGQHLAAEPFADAFAEDHAVVPAAERPTGPSRGLRPATVLRHTTNARWAASALVTTGVPKEAINSLADLVHPVVRARDIMRHFYVRGGNKATPTSNHIADVLRIIATYHAPVSTDDLGRLKRWAKAVRVSYTGMTAKNAATVRAALVPDRDAKLLQLPQAYMIAARSLRDTDPRKAAALALRAVGVDFLLRVPIRLSNVVGLRLDEHIQTSKPGAKIADRLMIPAHEVKNARPILMPIPLTTGQLIAEWCRDFRSAVASPGCRYLFPRHYRGDQGMTPVGFRAAIAGATHKFAGVRITPHQFRHIAAGRYLAEFPGQYEVVRQLLGHASLAMTVKHYAGIEAETAAKCFDAVVLAHQRKPSNKTGKHKPRNRARRVGTTP